jgi:5'-3' exonuclease
MEREKMK